MIYTREKLEEIEAATLAPYAAKSGQSRGRKYPEDEHPYRTAFQRDRDRIIHTTAFRRLEYKTQVFVNTEGDYYRTRLTHTLEVAQIARTIARALGANEDLAEAISLAHDLGHTPFGHSGEEALNELMKDRGGFDHNRQSVRIVEELERRYPEFRGLNLTWEVREGMIKHETEYDRSAADGYEPEKAATLEAQIVNVADEIAYNSHDLDDGLRAGILHPDMLQGMELWEELLAAVNVPPGTFDELTRHRIIRKLIGREVTDVVNETSRLLTEYGVRSVEDVRNLGTPIVRFSEELRRKNRALKDFLMRNFYRHYRMVRMSQKAKRMIADLFHAYTSNPAQLPFSVEERACDSDDLACVVCDYIAGMTDRFAIQEHQRLFDPTVQV
ncbi:MAG: deoxyguanosinetriphosphate triphosphohydrolase [Anaerolineae bacterium]